MKARRFVPNLKSEAKKEIIVKNVNDTEDIVTKESENSKISSISRLESETMERHEIVEHVPVESLPQSEDHVEVSHDMNIALTTLKEFATSPELSHQIIVNTGPSIRPSEEKTELLFGVSTSIILFKIITESRFTMTSLIRGEHHPGRQGESEIESRPLHLHPNHPIQLLIMNSKKLLRIFQHHNMSYLLDM